jgi:hypothetical protein
MVMLLLGMLVILFASHYEYGGDKTITTKNTVGTVPSDCAQVALTRKVAASLLSDVQNAKFRSRNVISRQVAVNLDHRFPTSRLRLIT